VVPPVPAIPEIAATTTASEPTPATPLPSELPANIPEARYQEQVPTTDTGALANTTAGAAPPLDALPFATAPVATSPPIADSTSAQQAATTPEQMNAVSAAAGNIPATPAPLDANPLRPSADVTPTDRYGNGPNAATTAPVATAAPATPVEQSFVESWPAIQALLDRGELTEAHKQLSKWYGAPSLTPTDAERVDTLLSQLAGTVVYSTEHRLAPARVVKEGETLETIAKECNVPWQLLAKINGVAAADQVRVGQELKVVRGPFSALVDLSRNQLTLLVDDCYAGRFPISVSPGHTISDGEWVVGDKSNPQAPGHALLLKGNGAASGSPAPQLIILGESLAANADGASSVITVKSNHAEELSDILSIGSRVVTRR
jgi:LysM repeat protein